MARPRSFNEDKVLDAAIDCFWRKGLKSASIRDLADEMGIAGPSLYNAYGCKQSLFARALERYADTGMRVRIARLEKDFPPKEALFAFFSETIDQALEAPDSRGCLLINTAMEVSPQDNELRQAVGVYLKEIQAFFCRTLKAGQTDSTISRRLSAEAFSRMLLALLLGIRVLARTQPSRDMLESAVAPALESLNAPSTPRKEV